MPIVDPKNLYTNTNNNTLDWGVTVRRYKRQPLDESSTHTSYSKLVEEMSADKSPIYRGQIVSVVNNDVNDEYPMYVGYGHAPYYIDNELGENTTYYADRILTMSYFNDVASTYYVNKYQLGTYYTGVGYWTGLISDPDNKDVVIGNTYSEIFNDYVTNKVESGVTYTHVEGAGNTASINASYAHIGGQGNTSDGAYSLTTGHANINLGEASIVGGTKVYNEGTYTVAAGYNVSTYGDNSIVAGESNKSFGDNAQIAGHDNVNGDKTGGGENSNVIGFNNVNYANNNYVNGHDNATYTNGNNSIVVGIKNVTYAEGSIIGGFSNTNNATYSVISGNTNNVAGTASLVGGTQNIVSSTTTSNIVAGTSNKLNNETDNSLTVGTNNTITTKNSIIGGSDNETRANNNIIGGIHNATTTSDSTNNNISGQYNTVQGTSNSISGSQNSHTGDNSLVSGSSNNTTGDANVIAGTSNTNNSDYSAVGGSSNTNTGDGSVVFGNNNTNKADNTLIVGSSNETIISNKDQDNEIVPNGSILFGEGNFTYTPGSIIGGQYSDVQQDSNTIMALGIGEDAGNRKNAIEIVHETEYGDKNNATTYLNGNAFTYAWYPEIGADGKETGNTYGVPSLVINQAYMSSYGVTKWQLGTEYTGVGKWWFDGESYSNQLGTYGEIFNDYAYNRASGAYSHAEGIHTYALGHGSHVEGTYNVAQYTASYSHIEGTYNSTYKFASHAEGAYTIANGITSHAEGMTTYAAGVSAHSEGAYTYAGANYSHAEGQLTSTYGIASHIEGYKTYVGVQGDIDSGSFVNEYGLGAHAEGIETSTYAKGAHAEGKQTVARKQYAHAEGLQSYAAADASHAEGNRAWAGANYSHAEGIATYSNGVASHSEGYSTIAQGTYSHAEGLQSQTLIYDASGNIDVVGNYAHAEGDKTKAGGIASHTEGGSTITRGNYSHAEGFGTVTGPNSSYGHTEGRLTFTYQESGHAEGTLNFSRAAYTHVEGYNNDASGKAAHVEGIGNYTNSNGVASHVEGSINATYAQYSHAEGLSNITRGESSHIEGTFNSTSDTGFSSHTEGTYNTTASKYSHTEGIRSGSFAEGTHTEGYQNLTYAAYSHSEGIANTIQNGSVGTHTEGLSNIASASSSYSHIEGTYNTTNSITTHIEGTKNIILANSSYSHAEGAENNIKGSTNHIEGAHNNIDGSYSHAEGAFTYVGYKAEFAHVEGTYTYAIGNGSHSEGLKSVAYGDYSHAGGRQSATWGNQSFAHGMGIHTYNSSEFAVGHWNRSYSDAEDRFYRSKYTHEWNSTTGTYTSNGIWPNADNMPLGAGGTLFTIGDGTGNTKHEAVTDSTTTYRHNILQINNDGSMLKNGNSYFNNDIFGPVSYTYVESLGISAYLTTVLSALLENPKYIRPTVCTQLSTVSSNNSTTQGEPSISFTTSSNTSVKVEVGTKFIPGIQFRATYVAPNYSDYDPIYHTYLGNRLGYSEGVTNIYYKRNNGGTSAVLTVNDTNVAYHPNNITATYTYMGNIINKVTGERDIISGSTTLYGLSYKGLLKSKIDDTNIYSGGLFEFNASNGVQTFKSPSTTAYAWCNSAVQNQPEILIGNESSYTLFKLDSYTFRPATQMYFQQLADKNTYVKNDGLAPFDKFYTMDAATGEAIKNADGTLVDVSYTSNNKTTFGVIGAFYYWYGKVKGNRNFPNAAQTTVNVTSGTKTEITCRTVGSTQEGSMSVDDNTNFVWFAVPEDMCEIDQYKNAEGASTRTDTNKWWYKPASAPGQCLDYGTDPASASFVLSSVVTNTTVSVCGHKYRIYYVWPSATKGVIMKGTVYWKFKRTKLSTGMTSTINAGSANTQPIQ